MEPQTTGAPCSSGSPASLQSCLPSYPDLGLQAVREALGIVVYVRSAFPPDVEGSAFVPVVPQASFPFSLAWRAGGRSAALDAVLAVALTAL